MSETTQVASIPATSRKPLREAASAMLAMIFVLASGAPGERAPVEAPCEPVEAAPLSRDESEVRRDAIRELARQHRVLEPSEMERVIDSILAEAEAADVDPLLVAAIVAKESSFRTDAVSSRGAVGLMQLRPFVARDVAFRMDLPWDGTESLHVPESNLRLGIVYFRELETRFDGDRSLALAAYHRGPTRLSRQLRSGTTIRSRYADEVLALYRELGSSS